MSNHRLRIAGLCGAVLACSLLGCGGSKPPEATGQPATITPGMEKMKGEMIKSFGATPEGKRALEAGKGKR